MQQLLFGVCAMVVLATPASSWGTAGFFDPTFGGGSSVFPPGIAWTDFGAINHDDAAYAVVVQPDGKIVAGGYRVFGDTALALARFAATGGGYPLDTSFGVSGQVTTHVANGGWQVINALALQPDGKIVAAGSVDYGAGNVGAVVARYNGTDGSLDSSFGIGGVAIVKDGVNGYNANAVVLQPDGKIVIGGSKTVAPFVSFSLHRLTSSGALDPTFGVGGSVVTPPSVTPPFPCNAAIGALQRQPDGKLVAAGWPIACFSGAILARYNVDGSLDGTFGISGRTTIPFSGGWTVAGARALALQSDGKPLVGGWVTFIDGRLAAIDVGWVARLTTGGTFDPTFGTGGVSYLPFNLAEAGVTGIVLQPDGKIVAAGTRVDGATPRTSPIPTEIPSDFSIARLNSNGTADTTFGGGGVSQAHFRLLDHAWALARQPDGKLVVAGTSSTQMPGTARDFTVMRFLGDDAGCM